ncbi:thiol-disulfide oxidoreductase DCC family protein [Candidatus Litorirhabdus singularis]|uniref:thiol-disulfide oxidoreductase DCC family protein n=1 Tax=Candidatus Litorirhabdus singularis TaxID=2518993 RepID=UPI002430ADC2|nr:DCC1-like thiol-disulfide oxidoreductase family protein [Candidatus Litorirhabdus singularis]
MLIIAIFLPANDTLFYDGKCSVCSSRAVSLLRRSDGRLLLRDIHSEQPIPNEPGKLLKLANLHLFTVEGHWLTGLDAALRAYSHTRWRWLCTPLRWRGLHAIGAWAYSLAELRRYRRLYSCPGCAPALDDR